MKPVVSIIVPVYKVEKYIAICIESIIKQTYTDLEIILVNDGSPDKSGDICHDYASRDNRIVVIDQDNKGLASARNTGLRRATGEFVYFVDSDDCINVRLIELAVSIAEKEKANIVQVGLREVPYDFMDFAEEIDGLAYSDDKLVNQTYEVKKYTVVDTLYNLEKSKTKSEYNLCLRTTVVWTKLYRKSAALPLLFPEGMRMHEDQMVAHRNFIAAGGMVFIDAPLYYYRQNDSSLIRVGWTTKRLSILDCYDDRQEAIASMQSGNQALRNFVHERFLVCIIRNYNMTDLKVEGAEKKTIKKDLRKKYNEIFHQKDYQLHVKKKLYFSAFNICPAVILLLLRIHDKRK